ncbi:MAG TPA: low temperature requirement protein A [Vicinamibacterales bacterium]|jgi:low temperature requirement protein LtrA|nr:low temperature requirement protein A [Vicinamibacterales bacterium]HEX2458819.1 low temperature requirement protein A [Vicinamibacterales bacterium]
MTRHSLAIVSPDDQKVTFVELFFDLVFVYCVTQVVTLLHGHIDWQSAGSALLVFWLVWWAWTQFTWALNAANTEHPRIQVITLLATAIAFLLAVGIPGALGRDALWFAGPYVALRVVGLLAYDLVASRDAAQRKAVRIFALVSITGLVAVMAGAAAGGLTLYWMWGLAIVLDLIAAGIGGQLEGWNLHPEHFVERHGLIVIIALGETLIVAAAGLVGATRTPAVIATGVLAVAVTCGLWWSYFRHAREALEHALATRTGTARSRLARDVFSVLHFPMLCGVIAIAAATEAALAHPEAVLSADLRGALGVGAMLFICGTAAGMWRAVSRPLPWRWAMAPLVAIVVFAVNTVPWVGMTLVLGMLVAIGAVEHYIVPPVK